MNSLTDEMLNKYIDGEIDPLELNQMKNELERNENAAANLRAMKAVDNSLRQMQIDEAPENFSGKLMDLILSAKKTVVPRFNYFFLSVLSIFTLGLVAVIIAAMAAVGERKGGSPEVSKYFDKIKEAIDANSSSIQAIFSNQKILLITWVSLLFFLMIIYFSVESHKSFTKKLNGISHS